MIRFMLMVAMIVPAIVIAWTDADGRSWTVTVLFAGALLIAATYAIPAPAGSPSRVRAFLRAQIVGVDPAPGLSRLDELDRPCCLVDHSESDPCIDEQLDARDRRP